MSMSTPSFLWGKSITCPIEYITRKRSPKNLLIVLVLATDSTMTRDFFILSSSDVPTPGLDGPLLRALGLVGFCFLMRQWTVVFPSKKSDELPKGKSVLKSTEATMERIVSTSTVLLPSIIARSIAASISASSMIPRSWSCRRYP